MQYARGKRWKMCESALVVRRKESCLRSVRDHHTASVHPCWFVLVPSNFWVLLPPEGHPGAQTPVDGP